MPCFMAQPGTRQDHPRVAGIADVDRQPGGQQLGVARVQGQRGLHHGAQVEAGGAVGGVGGQWKLVAQAGIKKPVLQLH